MDTKEINDEIIKIWNETDEGVRGDLSPMLYPELKDNPDVLFIGINPSFKEDYINNNNFKVNETGNHITTENFRFENINYNRETLIRFEEFAKKNYKKFYGYYDRLTGNLEDNQNIKLANQKKLDWESIDLFFIRNKKLGELKKIIYTNKKNGELTDFANKQLELAKKIIKNLNPKIMVVSSSSAAEIFKDIFEITMNDFDYDKGTFVKKIVEKETTIFFSGFLSNGSANENLLRFKWQLNRCFE